MSGRETKPKPADLSQCQAEKPNGPFRMGGPAFSRCGNAPVYVATEKKPPAGSKYRGSMSLCLGCYQQFHDQGLGASATFKRIGGAK